MALLGPKNTEQVEVRESARSKICHCNVCPAPTPKPLCHFFPPCGKTLNTLAKCQISPFATSKSIIPFVPLCSQISPQISPNRRKSRATTVASSSVFLTSILASWSLGVPAHFFDTERLLLTRSICRTFHLRGNTYYPYKPAFPITIEQAALSLDKHYQTSRTTLKILWYNNDGDLQNCVLCNLTPHEVRKGPNFCTFRLTIRVEQNEQFKLQLRLQADMEYFFEVIGPKYVVFYTTFHLANAWCYSSVDLLGFISNQPQLLEQPDSDPEGGDVSVDSWPGSGDDTFRMTQAEARSIPYARPYEPTRYVFPSML